jgi:hypothetical protein
MRSVQSTALCSFGKCRSGVRRCKILFVYPTYVCLVCLVCPVCKTCNVYVYMIGYDTENHGLIHLCLSDRNPSLFPHIDAEDRPHSGLSRDGRGSSIRRRQSGGHGVCSSGHSTEKPNACFILEHSIPLWCCRTLVRHILHQSRCLGACCGSRYVRFQPLSAAFDKLVADQTTFFLRLFIQ